jgi:hypothetical protein
MPDFENLLGFLLLRFCEQHPLQHVCAVCVLAVAAFALLGGYFVAD